MSIAASVDRSALYVTTGGQTAAGLWPHSLTRAMIVSCISPQ
ncbi:MAG: hypothetical protein VB858_01805 [Planctomycetaceae bacterium]